VALLLHKPGVTAPIVVAAKIEHLDDAVAAEQLTLDADEIARLEERYIPHAIPATRCAHLPLADQFSLEAAQKLRPLAVAYLSISPSRKDSPCAPVLSWWSNAV
jgi:hypothetical protein